MFNLKFFAVDNFKFQPLSALLLFVNDDKEIEKSLTELQKKYKIKLSELDKKNIQSDHSEIRISQSDFYPSQIIINKVKNQTQLSPDYFRNYLSTVINSLKKSELKNICIEIPELKNFQTTLDDEAYFYQTFVEGFFYGNYEFTQYKKEKKKNSDLNIYLKSNDKKKLVAAIKSAEIIMTAVKFTRDLQNEPGNVVNPIELAARVKKTLAINKIKVKVFDEKEIRKRKMGGVLSIASGSKNPPRFIVIEYKGNPNNKTWDAAYIGKGVTFDTGGISIKSAENMGMMKGDMSGAAVTAGALFAIASAKLPMNILGVIPAVENMPSGSAVRPGDIVKTSSGLTIEVDNTDAEGRVILSDALHYVSQQKPKLIIDLATLTGACMVALADFAAGLFTKNEKLADDLYKVGLKTHDRLWRLPLWDDYNSLIKSEVADVKNLGGKYGGAITAAKFLEYFVDKDIPWAHLDIAGPAMPNRSSSYTEKLMTGFGV
ncbi:MAG: leucyl aminopeptidase, partial [Chlorobiaceae bacterium]|nr:leucyl aminopeptidase [Chlorobiaceae bacterium]